MAILSKPTSDGSWATGVGRTSIPSPARRIAGNEGGQAPDALETNEITFVHWDWIQYLESLQDALADSPYINGPDGNIRVSAGSASWIGSVLVSTNIADAYNWALPGLRQNDALQITQIRVRYEQVGADPLQATLWEVDDPANAPGVAVATFTEDATTGTKWLTLAAVNRPLLVGYSWYLTLNHAGGSNTFLNISHLELTLGVV